MAELNDKQRMFAHEYLIDLNATEAAKRAGYAKKTAYSQGQRLLKHVEVQKLIGELMAEKEDSLIAKQDEVLKYLTRVMRRQEQEYTVVTVTKERSEYIKGDDGKMRKQTIKEEESEVVPVPARLSDANKAAELLGKRYAMWTDKTDITGSVGVEIVDDIGDDDDDD